MLIQIKNVSKTYSNGKAALKSVSFGIEEGEIFGLLGVNGSGKTTLSSILTALIPPTDGDVLWHNTSIYQNISAYKKIVGFCPQKPNLNNLLSVRDNLYYDGRLYGYSDAETIKKLDELVELLSLKEYLHSKPTILSGGYKQRVIIARALMHNPKFVLFDEPTVGLDPHIRHQLWTIIKDLKQNKITVLLTTHYLDEAEALSDRICILDKGSVLLIDTPENLKTKHAKANLEDVFIKLMNEESA